MLHRFLLAIMLFVCSITLAFAQKVQKVSAEYTYYAPSTMSIDEAKRTALDRAKIQALADEFGTIVSQNNTTIISNQNSQSNSHFFSFGGSEAKGEWIETIGEPVYDISYQQEMLVVKVKVEGRAREIVSAGIDVIAKILRNGTELKYEGYELRSGDDMFLYFKAPVDGYLAVYLLDEAAEEVYCLLPYKLSGEGAYPIEHDKEYVLFSKDHAKVQEKPLVDEYTMTCEKEVEYNDIYAVFSPSQFTKANSNDPNDEVLPRQLVFEDFQKWLIKNRKRDKKMDLYELRIKIQP